MRKILCTFAACLFLAAHMYAAGQNQLDRDVTAGWIQMKPGDRWTYDCQSKSGDRQNPAVQTWTTEEAVESVVRVPEGTVVVKNVIPRGRSERSYITLWSGSSFLIHDNCLYFLGPKDWDPKRQQLVGSFKKELAEGSAQPDLCFPLDVGRQWGGFGDIWHVVGFGRSDLAAPNYAESFHLTGRIGSGGATDLWFAKGIGIVAMHYLHQGTYDEFTKKLTDVQLK